MTEASDARPTVVRGHLGRVRVIAPLIAALAAAPSLLWAASGPDLLTDDFAHMARLDRLGSWDAMWDWSFVHPARPLLGPWHLVVYGLIGDHPVVQALLLAVLNAAVAVALWRFGRRLVREDVALAAAVLYAVVPNRASTRLWFPTGNYLLAILLVILASHLLFNRRRVTGAAVVFAVSVLLFEGVIGLAIAAIALWAHVDVGRRWRTALAVLTPTVAAGALVYLLSPKRGRDSGTTIGDSLDTVGEGLFGSGLWGEGVGATLGALAFAVLGAVGIASLLPSFSELRERTRAIRLGLFVTACSTAPFIGAGVIFGVRGIFDRANAAPLVGVTLVSAGALELAGRQWRPPAAGALGLAVVYLLALNLADVDDYIDAARVGEVVVDRVLDDVPRAADIVLVGPPIEEGTGIAPFVYPGDLDAALQLRTERDEQQVLMPWSASQCRSYAQNLPDAIAYDWHRREVLTDAGTLCDRASGG